MKLKTGIIFFILLFIINSNLSADESLTDDVQVVAGSTPSGVNITTLEFEYGSGKGQLGAFDKGEGYFLGPMSFTVDDKGNIYVCDTVNARIQIYSPEAEHLSTIPLAKGTVAEDVAVTDSGDVLVYDRRRRNLFQYAENGNIISSIPVDFSRGLIHGRMHIVGENIYAYAMSDVNGTGDAIIGRLLGGELKSPSDEQLKEPLQSLKSLKYGSSGRKYYSVVKQKKRGEVEVFERDGTATFSIRIADDEIEASRFLGEDVEGNIYVYTYKSNEDRTRRLEEVHKYSGSGSLLRSITLPKSNIYYSYNKRYEIGKDGAIYSFMPGEDKLRINKIKW